MAAYNASMITLMNELTQRQQEEAAWAATAATPKQAANKFPKMVTTFMQLCEMPTQQQVPPLYTHLANAGKQEVLSSLQALAKDLVLQTHGSLNFVQLWMWIVVAQLACGLPGWHYTC